MSTETGVTPLERAARDDPFPYGWRYVEVTRPNGLVEVEQVPLTLDDVLHPQVEDFIMHTDLHQRICLYLYDVFRGLLAAFPSAVVLHDVRVAWDVPEVRPHGPDVAVIFGVRERKNWSTFDVAKEGVRPTLIVEVTSPETRHLDLSTKLEQYDQVGVELYVIVDLVQRRGQTVPRLLGYRRAPDVYGVLAPDGAGRLWLEPLKIWLAIEGERVACYDASGRLLVDYAALKAALDAEQQARAAAEEARAAAEEARAAAEEALVAAEERARALEAELRRLRG